MLSLLIAYDAAGNVVATLDHMVSRDADGRVIGLIDFEAHETSGGKLLDVWNVQGAVGSGTWPEWIGAGAHDFTVEVDSDKRIVGLTHKASGHKRLRASVEAAIASRIAEAGPDTPADIRDLVGGPDRPMLLDENGRTKERGPVKRPDLPSVAVIR